MKKELNEQDENIENKEGVADQDDIDFEIDLEGDDEDLDANASDDDKDKKIRTLLAQKKHWKTKASTKPEEKKSEKKSTEKKGSDLSTDDLYSLMQSQVNRDDIPEVKTFASVKGITIAEALEDDLLKSILADKVERRNVANATNTGKTSTKSFAKTDSELLADSKKGILPDSDEDLSRLVQLRQRSI